jgi:glycosyltransferase involved in cell wall biosynthesis
VEEFKDKKLILPGDIAMTIWEASVFPRYCVEQLNRARSVITFSKWNAECLYKSGVAVPIHVIPLCVNMERFYPVAQHLSTCSFGAAGRIGPGGLRKGLAEVIKAFQEAFPWQRDVRLRLKLFPDCIVSDSTDPRVESTRKCMTPDELANWFRGNTAFVSMSRAEGWNHPLQEAMACAAVPIAAKFAGQAEFFDSDVGYELPYTLEDCDNEVYKGYGQWCVPSYAALVQIMRRIYLMRDEARSLGLKAAIRAAEFHWERTAAALENAICTSLF